MYLWVCVPGCRGHTGVVLCFLRHSEHSSPLHRITGAQDAARFHDDKPMVQTHTHTRAHARTLRSPTAAGVASIKKDIFSLENETLSYGRFSSLLRLMREF